jgi:hypothetical protein
MVVAAAADVQIEIFHHQAGLQQIQLKRELPWGELGSWNSPSPRNRRC